MSDSLGLEPDRQQLGRQLLPLVCGAIAIAVGVVDVLGWWGHWTTFTTLFPSTQPMKFNAGVGMIAIGLALGLLSFGYNRAAGILGVVTSLFMGSMLIENLARCDFGTDALFFRSYVHSADSLPDRASPLTAGTFVLTGISLFLTGFRFQPRLRLTLAGILTCMVGMIALVALLGYAFGIQTATGWGAFTRMSLFTAAAFLEFSVGLLIWLVRAARRDDFSFVRWLPVTASLTLMTMIALVSVASFTQAERSSEWRRHTYEVLDASQKLFGDIADMQRGMRANVLTGQPQYLAIYQAALPKLQPDYDAIVRLTADNPVQQAPATRFPRKRSTSSAG
jgi:hypothetical protein